MIDLIADILSKAYDVHLHASPCLQKRRKSVYELALEARDTGLRGFVVKDHFGSTAPQAAIINEIVPEVKVAGGITIGRNIGGFNPFAVETCFKMGGKAVWMPSLESQWMLEQLKSPAFSSGTNYKNLGAAGFSGGYYALDSDGNPIPEVKDIISLCCSYGRVFETSHFSKKETFTVLEHARKQGFKKFVVTHANTELTRYTPDEIKEINAMGGFAMLTLEPYAGKPSMAAEPMADLAGIIRAVGASGIILATDFGLNTWPSAVEGVRMLIAGLLELGIEKEELLTMLSENPEKLYMQ